MKFFTARCTQCGEEAVVEAETEGGAEAIWEEYKNCQHHGSVQVLSSPAADDGEVGVREIKR